MFQQSEQIDQIAAALADMQGDIESIVKDSKNMAFGSRYAELSKVWNAFQRVGPAHGLSVVQVPGHFDAHARTMTLSVRLLHSSGQWLGGDMSMPLSRADAHAYGSACTYARRYSLAALIGICPHDDDGNDASGIGPGSAPLRAPSQFQNCARTGRPQLGRAQSSPGDSEQAGRAHETDPLGRGPSDAFGAGKGRGTREKGAATQAANPALLESVKGLIDQSGTEVASLCDHFGIQSLDSLSQSDAERAQRLLKKKMSTIRQGVN